MAAPLPKAFWPLTIVAGVNDRIDFWVGGIYYAATVAPATYDHMVFYVGQTTPALLPAIDAALAAALGAVSWNTSLLSTGHVRIFCSAPVYLQFADGASLARSIHRTLGFADANLDYSTTQVAQAQHVNGWYADDPALDDTADLPTYNRAQGVALGGQALGLDFGTRYKRQIALGFLGAHKVFKTEEGASHLNEAIEHLFDDGWTRFRWWSDASVEASYQDYVLDLDTAKDLPRSRLSPRNGLYSLTLKMLKYVAP